MANLPKEIKVQVTGVVGTSLAKLGSIMKDKVTGFEGMVATVGFDVYGCVQAVVVPTKLSKEGKRQDGEWFDIKRLVPVGAGKTVMPQPFSEQITVGEEKGAEPKPASASMLR